MVTLDTHPLPLSSPQAGITWRMIDNNLFGCWQSFADHQLSRLRLSKTTRSSDARWRGKKNTVIIEWTSQTQAVLMYRLLTSAQVSSHFRTACASYITHLLLHSTYHILSTKCVGSRLRWVDVAFLQRAQCSHCKRCISYSNSVCLSVCLSVRLSVRPSHAGIVSKRRHVARCSLHRW